MMVKKIFIYIYLLLFASGIHAQSITAALEKAVATLTNDPQMKNASLGFYVSEQESGKMVFQSNGLKVLSPASTQKIFTAIAALDLLGKDYRYNTRILHTGKIEDGILKGDMIIKGSGDPSLGSWRYEGFKKENVKLIFLNALSQAGIRAIDGNIIIDNAAFELQPLPGGWPWDDIGNYYGAGAWGLNWNENQFDMRIRPGKKEGEEAIILSTTPELKKVTIINSFKTTRSEDTRLFFAPYSNVGFAEGTVPAGKLLVTASGAMPNPPVQFLFEIEKWLQEKNVYVTGEYLTAFDYQSRGIEIPASTGNIGAFTSPDLEKIEYWFMRKSVNLYGESFLKTIAYKLNGAGTTKDGLAIIKKFWSDKGIRAAELNIIDGSGLSPQNAVSAHSEVQALLYARNQSFFNVFFESLPVYNEMKMKSGTISRCKSFAGYQTSSSGKKYVYSIIINNYDGSAQGIVRKMYTLLDNLKKY